MINFLNGQFRLLISIPAFLLCFAAPDVKSDSQYDLKGQISKNIYTGALDGITCSLPDGFEDNISFFIGDDHQGSSESVTYGYDDGSHYLVFTIKKEAIEIKNTENRDMANVTFIKKYYGDNFPYQVSKFDDLDMPTPNSKGSAVYFEVQFDGMRQGHAYWSDIRGEHLFSIHFMPSLTSSNSGYIFKQDAEKCLVIAVNNCTFS